MGTTSGGEEDVTEGQKLVLPIDKSIITVMYKEDSPAYEHEHGEGYPHYAIDMYSHYGSSLRASGNGTVVGVGGSPNIGVGYWVAIQYNNVVRWEYNSSTTNIIPGVVLRYFHLSSMSSLEVGDTVNTNTIIGYYGNTGSKQGMDPHLHLEVDTDTNYPLYTPTLSGNKGGLYAGTRGDGDTTIEPCTVLFKSTILNQTIDSQQSYCAIHPGTEPYINENKVDFWKTQTA